MTTLSERIAKHKDHRTTVTTFGVVCSDCNEIVEVEQADDLDSPD